MNTNHYEVIANTKGQVVIPAALRRAFGIEDGTRIVVETDEKDQRIILTPVTREHIQRMRGKFRGSSLLKALAADKAREKAR